MDASRWRTLQDLFAAAAGLPPDEQSAYLARACAGEPDLQAELEGLLDAHQRAGSFIEPVPDCVGPYRLLEEMGHGGMGTVYRAARNDGQFQHQVAVKLLSLAGSASLYRRFQDERQILAHLSHPNIARLLDGGVTPSGVSYIVMECVDGLPIDQYCQGRPIPERLDLFRTICAAVHYAHQNLVVHRDLKPANILVTPDGTPKLLDFGIAKILTPGAQTGTATILPVMTPEYASPEQVRGEPISTASDVYSLGVLLHEVVTGRRPYAFSGKTYHEAMRIICEQPLNKPCAGSADLDAIIIKAMRKEPGERYASAEALSADIARHLSRRPVEARRGAFWYVFTRFLARNRAVMSMAAAAVVLLAIAVAITVRESRVAARRFQDVRQLANAVMFQIHDAVAALPGSTAARKLIVANALDYLDKLSRDAADDLGLQLELAQAYQRLGQVQGLQSQANLGDTNGAIASYQKSRALFANVLRSRPADTRATLGLAQACRQLGLVLTWTRRREEAAQMEADAVRVLEDLVRRLPTDAHRKSLAGAYLNMADVLESDLEFRHKALAILEDLLAAHKQDRGLQREVALAHKNIAGVLVPRKHEDKAVPHLKRAEELDAARVAADAGDRLALMDLSFDYSQNGTFYSNRAQFRVALDNFQKALDIRRRLAQSDPADVRLQERLVYSHISLGRVRRNMNKPAAALESFREALRISEALVAGERRNPQHLSNLATSRYWVGNSESLLGHKEQACSAWRAASALYQEMKSSGQLGSNDAVHIKDLDTSLTSCR